MIGKVRGHRLRLFTWLSCFHRSKQSVSQTVPDGWVPWWWREVGAWVYIGRCFRRSGYWKWRKTKADVHKCNTRFIKGHKPSNHISARIKSHVYTIEWTVYHSTYHIKRYNKANTNVIYYINDKMSDTAEAKYKNTIKTLWSWSRAPQGRRLGDEHLEVLVVLVALDELPRVGRNWTAVA